MRKIIKIIFLSSLPIFTLGTDFELDKIVSDAKQENKHVMLFFHKDGCNFCDKMIFNLEDSNISQSIKKDFILVDINRDDDETISFKDYEGSTKGFLKKLDINLYPTITFLDKNATFIHNVVGYRNLKKFTTILNYIQKKLYDDITFEEYEDELLSNEE